MKKLVLFFVVLFTICTFSQSFYWEKILNYYTVDVNRFSNGYLLASNVWDIGVLRSTNQGLNWEVMSLPISEYKIVIDQNDIIYLGGWVGIYKSTDYGNTWLQCYSENVHTIYISSENIIYAGGYQGEFIKSTDLGSTWSSDSLTNRKINSITSTSNGQIFLTAEYGPIFTSTDYGDSWSEITISGLAPRSNIIADSFDNLYICKNEQGVGISTDLGATWNSYGVFGYSPFTSFVAIDNAHNIYYSFGPVYKSTDMGLTWTNMSGPGGVKSISLYEDKILLATGYGIYRYDPSYIPPPVYVGNNYFPLLKGFKQQFLNESNFIGVQHNSLESVEIIRDTLIQNLKYIFYTDKLLSYSEENKKIWIWSMDSAKTYMDFTLPAGATFPHYTGAPYNFQATVFDGSKILFGDTVKYKGNYWGAYTYGYFSESFGENIGLIRKTSGSTAGPDGSSVSSLIMQVMFDSLGNEILLSDHHKPVINLIPKTKINTNNFTLNFSVGHYYSSFFDPNSPHQGVNFIKDVLYISNYSKNDTIILNDTIAAYNTPKTSQYSTTFTIDTSLLKNGYTLNYKVIAKDKGLIQETTFSPDTGFYQCVWDYETNIDYENESARKFSLSQNYPNPFNPSTTISYQLPKTGNVTIKVFDILGREIATLVNEEKPAGNYDVEFKSSTGSLQLASGIYYYQLKAGDYLETKKMILMK